MTTKHTALVLGTAEDGFDRPETNDAVLRLRRLIKRQINNEEMLFNL